jgi:hypothetical protein
MLAILVDAINVLHSRNPGRGARKRQTFGEAWAWVLTRGNPSLFSFDGVCDALNILPEILRKRLSDPGFAHGAIGSKRPYRLRIHGSNRMGHMTATRVYPTGRAFSRNNRHRLDRADAPMDDLSVR